MTPPPIRQKATTSTTRRSRYAKALRPFTGFLLASAFAAAGAAGCFSKTGAVSQSTTDGGATAALVRQPRDKVACTPARASAIPLHHPDPNAGTVVVTVDELGSQLTTTCGGCHGAPNKQGNYSFVPQYDKQGDAVGIADFAVRASAEIAAGRMPPAATRADPVATYDLGNRLAAWVAAGKPRDSFVYAGGTNGPLTVAADVGDAMTPLGNCIPQTLGTDEMFDGAFATMTTLPLSLKDTDMFSLDGADLGAFGTVAYMPTYQLWSDDAKKIRHIHVPAGKAVTYDAATGKFNVPDNTRFYKTFLKEVRQADGATRFRRMETRLIVVRTPQEKSLYGTYIWGDNESDATLLTDPLRNGEPFRDRIASYLTDEVSLDRRTYAFPGSSRCAQCHSGSESEAFVLGFSPLQLNRRRPGEGGLEWSVDVPEDELGQVDRLVSLGVVKGISGAQDLPILENTGPADDPANPGVRRRPRNDSELRVQAYAIGNCAHCHNPSGYPVRDNPDLAAFNLSAGGVLFGKLGESAAYDMYRRVANITSVTSDGTYIQHMPVSTAGKHCAAVQTFALFAQNTLGVTGELQTRFSGSLSDSQKQQIAADATGNLNGAPSCTNTDDISWVPEDFTEPPVYIPRRADFLTQMPDELRNLPDITPAQEAMAKVTYPVGYYEWRPECKFPATPAVLAPAQSAAFVKQPGRSDREIATATPGAFMFHEVCAKCHGSRGESNSGPAKALAALSGGEIRVANFREGMFGPLAEPGKNLHAFDELGKDGARKYIAWMTSGGTQVVFPAAFSSLLGEASSALGAKRPGANMAFVLRESASQLLPLTGIAAPRTAPGQIYTDVFTLDNAISSGVAFGDGNTNPNPHPIDGVAQGAWLDRATWNALTMIYLFLRDEAPQNKFYDPDCRNLP